MFADGACVRPGTAAARPDTIDSSELWSASSVSWTLPPCEPSVESWSVTELSLFSRSLLGGTDATRGRPQIVAVDGRGAAGKSTLARAICHQVERSAIVHTDDVAWNEPYFRWEALVRDHILRPLHDGREVDFTPPSWAPHHRRGAIEVAPGLQLVVVEGTGAAQAAFSGLLDMIIWVQSDFALAEMRGIARDTAEGVNGNEAETVAFWHEWMAEELTFFEREQPWARADWIVAGTPPFAAGQGFVAVHQGPLAGPHP